MSLKKMIIGEEMPSKDDPKYKERYLREKEAGMKFAEKSGINFLVARIQAFANNHRIAFIGLVFTIVIGCLGINVVNMIRSYKKHGSTRTTAVEKVDFVLLKRQQMKECP